MIFPRKSRNVESLAGSFIVHALLEVCNGQMSEKLSENFWWVVKCQGENLEHHMYASLKFHFIFPAHCMPFLPALILSEYNIHQVENSSPVHDIYFRAGAFIKKKPKIEKLIKLVPYTSDSPLIPEL